eukprot:TRINITY_DN1505_c0_g1_i2.p1 TRINITY_DN1505_c0_g1~~TRINITY_DN1505_c0_g1_i2.p1  ORF type:complete len:369 (+),score=104.69 TRINITY_DN1505_c0_g1_i2:67-1173(+)
MCIRDRVSTQSTWGQKRKRMKIFAFLMLAAVCLGSPHCAYGVCNTGVMDPMCFDTQKDPVWIKKCAPGSMCLVGMCVPKPDTEYVTVGNRASSANKCVSGKLNGKYCQGVPLGGSCDNADQKKKCDVGLYCNAGLCAQQLADGADCKAGACQSTSFCSTDNKCRRWHTIDSGTPSPEAKGCKSGYTLNGVCRDRPTVEKEWIDYKTEPMMACRYSDQFKMPAMCVMYSGDQNKTGYCMNFAAYNLAPYMDFVSKYAANSCAFDDPLCDKAADAYGCPKWKDVLRSSLAPVIAYEAVYPECEEKMITKMIDEYTCFGKELMWGFLTLLAILLFIQLNNSQSQFTLIYRCLLYTSPSPRDLSTSRMPSSA